MHWSAETWWLFQYVCRSGLFFIFFCCHGRRLSYVWRYIYFLWIDCMIARSLLWFDFLDFTLNMYILAFILFSRYRCVYSLGHSAFGILVLSIFIAFDVSTSIIYSSIEGRSCLCKNAIPPLKNELTYLITLRFIYRRKFSRGKKCT